MTDSLSFAKTAILIPLVCQHHVRAFTKRGFSVTVKGNFTLFAILALPCLTSATSAVGIHSIYLRWFKTFCPCMFCGLYSVLSLDVLSHSSSTPTRPLALSTMYLAVPILQPVGQSVLISVPARPAASRFRSGAWRGRWRHQAQSPFSILSLQNIHLVAQLAS